MVTNRTVDALTVPEDQTEEVPLVEELPSPAPPSLRRRRTLVVTGIVVVLLAGAGVGIWLATSGSTPPALQVTTQVTQVTTGTMRQTVATSGTIQPAEQENLNFAVSGQVTTVDVSTGQTVTAGQALAKVDPAALQAQLDAAQASLTAARATLSSDEASGAIASQIDSDEASVTSAQSQLTTAQTDLVDATLTSPIAGTVASVSLTVGEQVSGSGGSSSPGGGNSSAADSSSSSSSSSSSAQVVVVSTDSFVVATTVDDTQVGQVKVGDQATIVPSGSSTTYYGTVSSVGLIASGSSSVASFPVDIAVTGTPRGLYPGATASVSIIVEHLNDVVQVPTSAIDYTNGQATVTVVSTDGNQSRPVTTGVTENGFTQITKGLRPGEKILERVVTFNPAGRSGGGRSLFGGGGGLTGAGGLPDGGFGGGFNGGNLTGGGPKGG
jgi:multidrug efflux pump subunit AcrA (membrane-fusion protein)